jgi:hypothetical protein
MKENEILVSKYLFKYKKIMVLAFNGTIVAVNIP